MPAWIDASAELSSGVTGWREVGSGPPLLFLHGLGGTRGSWNPQLAYFGSSHRCIAWDMPGYGASTGESPLTYERIAARFVELLDHLQIDQADMVGLSFGGMHALHTALNHPSRVVLTQTSSGGGGGSSSGGGCSSGSGSSASSNPFHSMTNEQLQQQMALLQQIQRQRQQQQQ